MFNELCDPFQVHGYWHGRKNRWNDDTECIADDCDGAFVFAVIQAQGLKRTFEAVQKMPE